MTREELQAIRELVNKATPGPWKVDWNRYMGWNGPVEERVIVGVAQDVYEESDAEFIAWCREGVPKLLDEVERLRDALSELADTSRVMKAAKHYGPGYVAAMTEVANFARQALDGDTA
jgi:hypothetical protein